MPLFTISNVAESVFSDLDSATLSSFVMTAFQNAGYALLADSVITVLTSSSGWRIENGGETPPDSSVGSAYATFDLSKTTDASSSSSSSSSLKVYGSSLWITAIGNDGHLSTSLVPFDATGLSAAEMTPVKDFPNGEPPSAYPDRYSWEQMVTAKTPPPPPVCVPSPNKWCIPPKASWAYRQMFKV
jgi:hypothetical protein